MKKFAASLLTALCFTAFSAAQSIGKPTDPTYETAKNQTTAQSETITAEQAFAESQAKQTTATSGRFQTNSELSSTTELQKTQDNNVMPIDEQQSRTPPKSLVGVGATVSFIYGSYWGFKDLEMDPPNGFGGNFGVAARFTITNGLLFSPEFSFRFFNLSHDDDDNERHYNQMFLDFSFILQGAIGEKIFLEVGPQISININSNYEIDDYTNNFDNIEQATFEFGLNFGIGYRISDKLSVNLRGYCGFTEVFPDVKYWDDLTSDDYDSNNKLKSSIKVSTINLKGAHTMMFKLGVTYWFL